MRTVLLALFLSSCASSPKQPQTIGGYKTVKIDTIQTVFDTIKMGRVNEGEILSGTFAVVNESPKPMIIASIVTGCGCTTTDYDTQPIKAGEERLIKFMFDTRARYGKQLKSIEVVTTDHRKATIFLEADIAGTRQ